MVTKNKSHKFSLKTLEEQEIIEKAEKAAYMFNIEDIEKHVNEILEDDEKLSKNTEEIRLSVITPGWRLVKHPEDIIHVFDLEDLIDPKDEFVWEDIEVFLEYVQEVLNKRSWLDGEFYFCEDEFTQDYCLWYMS